MTSPNLGGHFNGARLNGNDGSFATKFRKSLRRDALPTVPFSSRHVHISHVSDFTVLTHSRSCLRRSIHISHDQIPLALPQARSRTPSVSSSLFRALSTTDRGALIKEPPLCRAKHQYQSSTHPIPRCAYFIRARSILAQSSAAASQGFE